jgi:alkylation response protein AidB-like acyl-CoA dehydrogenase
MSLDAALAQIRPIVRETLAPIEQRFLATGSFKSVEADLKKVRDQVRAAGLSSPQLPKEHGGAGFSLVDFARISEELGWNALGHYTFNCQAPDAGNMEILALHGTPAQRKRYLEPLVGGEIRSCFGMTEPDAPGSNPTQLFTTAVLDGASWVIRGKKWFTSSADGAAFCVVMAVTEPDAPPHARASQLLVPTNTPGFKFIRNIPVMGHSGDGWASHSEIAFEDCRVPADALLGKRGAGFAIAQERLGPGRIQHTMRWMGIAERSLDMLCRRAASREIEPGKRLADKDVIRSWVAECRADIDAAKLLIMRAAQELEHGGSRAARDSIGLVKFHAADVLTRVLDRAIQVHGALGVTDDIPLAYFYRQERAAHIYDGADEVHKLSVGKRILRGYAGE